MLLFRNMSDGDRDFRGAPMARARFFLPFGHLGCVGIRAGPHVHKRGKWGLSHPRGAARSNLQNPVTAIPVIPLYYRGSDVGHIRNVTYHLLNHFGLFVQVTS